MGHFDPFERANSIRLQAGSRSGTKDKFLVVVFVVLEAESTEQLEAMDSNPLFKPLRSLSLDFTWILRDPGMKPPLSKPLAS